MAVGVQRAPLERVARPLEVRHGLAEVGPAGMRGELRRVLEDEGPGQPAHDGVHREPPHGPSG
eukprot:10198471-Alexandrium_andersonii.AAC.1